MMKIKFNIRGSDIFRAVRELKVRPGDHYDFYSIVLLRSGREEPAEAAAYDDANLSPHDCIANLFAAFVEYFLFWETNAQSELSEAPLSYPDETIKEEKAIHALTERKDIWELMDQVEELIKEHYRAEGACDDDDDKKNGED